MTGSKCIYCGSTAFGVGCAYSPTHLHVHATDDSACMYCGQPIYGGGCRYSPNGRHKHGHTKIGVDGKCRYCGARAYGVCGMSPTRYHEH